MSKKKHGLAFEFLPTTNARILQIDSLLKAL
jgi:hypothetical protein